MNIKANIQISNDSAVRTAKNKHPFAAAFFDLADYKPEDALAALTKAIHAERRGEQAWDWVQEALPGAVMKPNLAIGTLDELYRTFSRDQEFIRFASTLQDRHH